VRLRGLQLIGIAAVALGCARVVHPGSSADAGSSPSGRDATAAVDVAAAVDAADAALDRWTALDLVARPEVMVSPDATPAGNADAACATQSAMAETLPLDLYVMMDSSGSMAETTTSGQTKWDAVRTAMKSFFNDPRSAGLGIALQYFPQLQANVPASCSADSACGSFGPCDRIRTCFGPATTTIVTCTTSATCRAGESCVPLGACPLFGGSCAPVGTICPLGDPCVERPGNCRGRDRCDIPAYATPAVAAATLPGAIAALASSLDARMPDGLTPTGPALAGAIQSASAHAAANPDRKAAVVLVTDGLPTECAPVDIPAIAALAAAGAAGTPPTPTFVIGVFAPDEAATAAPNLNALAAAGGTGSAVVIDTNQNVTAALQAALDKIRTTAVACEYRIPPASTGAIDFGKVNVRFTGGGGAQTTIGYVANKASCDVARGGWYYDVDPATGQTPTSIVACDATCAQFRGDAAARVDIVLGCATIVITLDDRDRVERSAASPRGAHRGGAGPSQGPAFDRSRQANDRIQIIPRIGPPPPC